MADFIAVNILDTLIPNGNITYKTLALSLTPIAEADDVHGSFNSCLATAGLRGLAFASRTVVMDEPHRAFMLLCLKYIQPAKYPLSPPYHELFLISDFRINCIKRLSTILTVSDTLIRPVDSREVFLFPDVLKSIVYFLQHIPDTFPEKINLLTTICVETLIDSATAEGAIFDLNVVSKDWSCSKGVIERILIKIGQHFSSYGVSEVRVYTSETISRAINKAKLSDTMSFILTQNPVGLTKITLISQMVNHLKNEYDIHEVQNPDIILRIGELVDNFVNEIDEEGLLESILVGPDVNTADGFTKRTKRTKRTKKTKRTKRTKPHKKRKTTHRRYI
jgi:hypothetical protein